MPDIFLVEDNPIDARLVHQAFRELKDWPTRITWVNDGQKALSHLHLIENGSAELPALVLLDLNLPKYDGVQVLAAFRRSAAAWKLPIFMFSSSPSEEVAALAESRQVHADGYLEKPHGVQGFKDIAEKLRHHLENSRRGAVSKSHALEFSSYAT